MSQKVLDHLKMVKTEVIEVLKDEKEVGAIDEMFENIKKLVEDKELNIEVDDHYHLAVIEITPLKQLKALYRKDFEFIGDAELNLLAKSIKWINFICLGPIKLAVAEDKLFFAQFHSKTNKMLLIMFVEK